MSLPDFRPDARRCHKTGEFMKNQVRWLLGQLDLWVAEGLVQPEQAAALRRRYEVEQATSGLPWGVLLFGGFGAVVAGLGIILLFAYNWHAIPKFGKLGLVFGLLAAAHGAAWFVRRRHPVAGEILHLFGTMLFGAGIWLVAQIYHISEHYPNAFFVWSAGALAMAWAMPSTAQGLLAAVLLCVWSGTELFHFHHPMYIAPLLVLVGVGGLAWVRRSPVLLTAAAAAFGFCLLTCSDSGQLVMPMLLATTVLYLAGGEALEGRPEFPAAGAILRGVGKLLYYPLLFLLTFRDFSREAALPYHDFTWAGESLASQLAGMLPLLAAVAAAVLAWRTNRSRPHEAAASVPEAALARSVRAAVPVAISCVFLAAWWLAFLMPAGDLRSDLREWLPDVVMVAANLAFLFHAMLLAWSGCRDDAFARVIAGSVLLAAWVFARFCSLFDSLLVRGVVFLVLGAALFAVAVLFHRLRTRGAATDLKDSRGEVRP